MEFNDLIENGDFLELRHIINRPDAEGHVIIARFNAALVSRAQAGEVAALLGYPLPATPGEFLDKVGKGDFSRWEVTDR